MDQKNNIKFNQMLNACAHPESVYAALSLFAKPGVKQSDNMADKRQVIIGEILPLLNQSQPDQ